MATEPSARYVYCVTTRLERSGFVHPGIDGRPVYPVSHGGLSALVHDCRPQPYHGADETVKRWVAEHAAIVDAAWEAAGTVLPMTFDVIIVGHGERSAEENLRAWLEHAEDQLTASLERFRNKAELGVQILWNTAKVAQRASAASAEIARLEAEMAGKPAGVAYFYRHQIAEALRAALEAKADADYRTYYERITPYADDIVVNRPTSQTERQTILSLSLLVSKQKVAALGDELTPIAAQEGLEVRFTGPWPPYSFAAKIAASLPPGEATAA